MLDVAVDLHAVLPHSEQGRGRPLQAEEGGLSEALSDLVTLCPPASQLRVGLLPARILLQADQHLVDSPAPAGGAVEAVSEGDGALAGTAEHQGEAGEEGEGELTREETNVSSITEQSHLLRPVTTEDIIIELLTQRQESAFITVRKQKHQIYHPHHAYHENISNVHNFPRFMQQGRIKNG